MTPVPALPPYVLCGQASVGLSPLQPGVLRVGQRSAFRVRQARKALQFITPVWSTPCVGTSQSMLGDRSWAHRVQSSCEPPQHVPSSPQAPLAQSALTEQVSPGAQRLQAASLPPQSVSVSLPFWAPSVHEMQTCASQLWLAQSESSKQLAPASQRWHAGSLPPQSVSVSVPLRASSSQVATTHCPAWQSPL